MPTKKQIHAAGKEKPVIALSAPVTVTAASEQEGKKTPPKFQSTFYTGGALEIAGWDLPLVVDLSGLDRGNVLVANLDHDRTKRVGNFEVLNDGRTLVASGTATAKTAARDEVVGSAEDGYLWQSSLEVDPKKVEELKAGKTEKINGQSFSGPIYVVRKGTLKGFAFVSHGADDNTNVSIAARAALHKEKVMDPELKAWIEAIGFDVESLSTEQLDGLKANYAGKQTPKTVAASAKDGMERRSQEASRRKEIKALAEEWCDNAIEAERYEDVDSIRKARDEAIKAGTPVSDFRYELRIATLTEAPPVVRSVSRSINDRVLEAAICTAGRLKSVEQQFDDQTMQLAHDHFKGRISLRDAFIIGAEANGYQGRVGASVDAALHNAAFGLGQNRQVRGSGFSTLSLPNVFSAVSNKFLREGWMAVDQTPLRLANVRSVSDFKAITTVSLTGGMQFQPIGPDGELKHGALGEETYTNQVSPAGVLFSITFVDIRNDDLGALTATPKRIGRGGMLYLNHIFWTKFLNNSAFFTSGRLNVNEAVADMTVGGLAATETIFLSQTDPDGLPLGTQPAILLVPTALKAAASTLMNSERLIDGTSTAKQGDANIFKDRFRVESSPYMHNAAYTGNSSAAWYLLADPNDMPVVEVAALDGQVQPMVETADASFNVLGVQMRGHSHVGVELQEYRGGVRADGGSS